ncbi:hypothetical protein ACJJTC_008356 [Scirpophaga incertulas]
MIAELGNAINSTLQNLFKNPMTDEAIEKSLKEICTVLIRSNIGIVCADTFRAGAFDQVKQNAIKINVPYFGSSDPDPVKVAKEGVAKFKKNDFELILVDTSGRHTQESDLFAEMKEMISVIAPNNIVFVMDAGIGQSAEDQALGFKNAVKVGGIILTKLDGASKAGGALSSVAATNCPIEFIGTGEGMEEFDVFDAKRFVSKMLGMGDIEGLIDKISTIDIDEGDMMNKLSTGTLRLIDFKNIFSQILSLGPVSKMFEMIPGMNNISIPDETKFNKILYAFDSMTREELESNGNLFFKQQGRVMRIAKGCGLSKEFVMDILTNYRQSSSVMKNMMKNPMLSQMFSGGLDPKAKKRLMNNVKGKIPAQLQDYLDQIN